MQTTPETTADTNPDTEQETTQPATPASGLPEKLNVYAIACGVVYAVAAVVFAGVDLSPAMHRLAIGALVVTGLAGVLLAMASQHYRTVACPAACLIDTDDTRAPLLAITAGPNTTPSEG